jgi:hypothetical protein
MKEYKLSHLGKGPFKCLEYIYMPEGNSCSHCYTFIKNCFKCEDSEGKKFWLGSQCIEKLNDKGLVKEAKELKTRADQILKNEKYAKVNQERVKAFKELEVKVKAQYSKAKEILKSQPHPNTYFASQGKTMLDYLDYFLIPDSEFPNWSSPKVSELLEKALKEVK